MGKKEKVSWYLPCELVKSVQKLSEIRSELDLNPNVEFLDFDSESATAGYIIKLGLIKLEELRGGK